MDPRDERRERVGAGLDRAEHAMLRVYHLLLWGLLLMVVGVATYIAVRWGGQGNRGAQGEWFYFGIGVLLIVGWLGSRLAEVRRRRRRVRSSAFSLGVRPSIESGGEGLSRTWSIRFGSTSGSRAQEGEEGPMHVSRSFKIPLASLPANVVPDASDLDRIQVELARGSEMDAACAAVQPAYPGWNHRSRRAYRFLVERLLEERGQVGG